MTTTPIHWSCYFTQDAETFYEGSKFEPIVKKGRTPVSVQATSELGAAAEFIHAIAPGTPRPRVLISPADPHSLQSYIQCERIPRQQNG